MLNKIDGYEICNTVVSYKLTPLTTSGTRIEILFIIIVIICFVCLMITDISVVVVACLFCVVQAMSRTSKLTFVMALQSNR